MFVRFGEGRRASGRNGQPWAPRTNSPPSPMSAVRGKRFESARVDPAIHNSNTFKFRGGRLTVPSTEDHRFPEELALEAVRHFMEDHQVPTAELWAAAGLSPTEKTIRRRFGSFRAATRLAGGP
jgi:hypothetical protein